MPLQTNLSFVKKHATIQTSQLVKLLENLRKSASVSTARRLSFDDLEDYTDTDLLYLTALKKHQFEELVEMVTTLKKSKLRSPRLAIGVLLVKLRTGLSQGYIISIQVSTNRSVLHANKPTFQCKTALLPTLHTHKHTHHYYISILKITEM